MRYSFFASLALLLRTGTVLAKPVLHDIAIDKTLNARYGPVNIANRATFAVDLVRNNDYRRNGAAELAWTYAKYNKDPAGVHTNGNDRLSSGPIGAYNQTYDREYLSPVYMGEPGQLCWLDIDTGSGDLSDTPSFYLDGQEIYHPEKSRTSVDVANASWSITYGDGSYAGGGIYRDSVRIGNVTLHNATVESATAVSRSLTTDPVMSGILGLALNHSSTTYPQQPTLLDALRPVLEENLFAADLKYQDVGQYHFGYINQSSYTGDITWRTVLPHSGFWEFYIQSIHIGGDNVWRMHNWPVVADTGTTLLLLPTDLVELYWSFVPGAYMSDVYYGWVFPCNVTLPVLDFGFVDDHWNATIPGHYFNFQNVSDALCYGGIQDSMEPFGILGDAFLKALYMIFDMGHSRVGLASKKLLA
ncbi:aspartic proteinase [Sporothrix brasiliensis 5110]|uniref:Aspartic proteinase n=1 Tax=Sporothrix brasiliensis 5110 TaxID=1398154 RepID=A0A0C2F825_9PEZI|nr:aspartic proteinase [Sporothrix brasiliensis 5110]KIH95159.1 aspartic proteinase [Sporothrix brasiliensis 5110]